MSQTVLPEEFASLVDYITKTYRHVPKIVEVGVGRFCKVAVELKNAYRKSKSSSPTSAPTQ